MLFIKYKTGLLFKKLKPYFSGVQVKEVLNGVGEFSFSYPLGDELADFLTERNEIQIIDADFNVFFQGKIISINKTVGQSPAIEVSGIGLMEEFNNRLTVPNTVYINELYTDILDPTYIKSLIRPNTWSTLVEPTLEDLTYISSLQTSLKTFNVVRERIGYHFRYIGTEATPRYIEFGSFGQDSGVRVRAYPKDHFTYTDDLLFFLDGQIVQITEAGDIVNRVFPLGGGNDNGINQITLRDVDPTIIDPDYPILTSAETPNDDVAYDSSVYANEETGPNTFSAYYLEDAISVAQYGIIERPITKKDVYPVASGSQNEVNSVDRQNAANELYRSAVEFLRNNAEKKETYQVSCVGKATNLNVGDKVNLKFKGKIQKITPEGNDLGRTYLDIDKDLYVLDIQISWQAQNVLQYTMTVSTVPIFPETGIDNVAKTVDTMNDYSRQRKGSVTTYPVFYKDSLDNLFPAKFLLWIPNETIFTDYLKLKVKIREFRAYSKATQGGGATTATSSSGGGTTVTSGGGGGVVTTTDDEGTGASAHQHLIDVFDTASSKETLEGLGYKYVMVQPGGGGTAGPCASGNIGLLWAADSDGEGDDIYFKTDCTINGHHHSLTLSNHTHSVTIASHTHNVTLADHTHAITFGIFEDTTPPTNVKVLIDNVDYSSELSGPWSAFGSFPATTNQSFDLLKAADNLGQLSALLTPGEHEIKVTCTAGRCLIELFVFNQFYLSSR